MGVLVNMERYVIRLLRRMPLRYFRFAMKFWAVSSGRRVGSLAADTAFWLVFSLPWLVLAFASTVGFVVRVSGSGVDEAIKSDVAKAITALVGTDVAVQYAIPAFEQMFDQGLKGLGIVGYLVAFYSGSRAVRSFVGSVGLVSGDGGERRQLRSRLQALGLYLIGVIIIVLAFSMVTVGTDELADLSGMSEAIFQVIDVLLLVLAGTTYLWSLFHFSMQPRLPWRRDVPAAFATLLVGAGCILFVAWYAAGVVSRSSIGALVAAPFVAMLTTYVAVSAALYLALASAIINGRDVFNFDSGPRQRYHDLQRLDVDDRAQQAAKAAEPSTKTGP